MSVSLLVYSQSHLLYIYICIQLYLRICAFARVPIHFAASELNFYSCPCVPDDSGGW